MILPKKAYTNIDNGLGLSDDFDLDSEDNLGSLLIDTFAAQLNAEIDIENTGEGSKFAFTFSKN